MLIITRREGESVIITDSNGERMSIKVAGYKYGQTRLEICGPMCFIVQREEIQDKIDEGLNERRKAQAGSKNTTTDRIDEL